MNYRFQNQSKTEPKPIEKQSKKNSKMDFKIYSCELEQESSINLNTKIMNFISSVSLIDQSLRIIIFFYLKNNLCKSEESVDKLILNFFNKN